MYAIIDADGVQYKVEEGMTLRIDKKPFEDNQEFIVPKVVYASNGESAVVGAPYIDDANVEVEFLENVKDKKVVVFKKKRRKGYSKKQGHRQEYSLLKIKKINVPETAFN